MLINALCIHVTAWSVYQLTRTRARLESDRIYARLEAQQAWREVVRLKSRLPPEPLPSGETPPGPIEAK
jgi:hypothetical protein